MGNRALKALVGSACLWAVLAPPALAEAEQTGEEAVEAVAPAGPAFKLGIEAKANLRVSDENRFPFVVPPVVGLPPGSIGFLETVNQGTHLELSVVTLFADATWGESLAAHAKVDFIDLYDRNPTSEDQKVDVDEAWVRFGREREPAVVPERPGAYLKVGKMAKFERQNDRHLESYGLVSTAFNRFEDQGLELGVDLGRHLYLRGSLTQGNPLFFRDPNALAGDNGTSFFKDPIPGQEPPLKSGILIFYDAEVEDLDLDGKPETGAALGWRWSDAEGNDGVDVMVWGYRRKLAKTVALNGTFYGGDLDLLNGPFDATPFPVNGDRKQEVGANLWLYLGSFSFFAQYVDQDLAGLGRKGLEGEVAWRFDLPLRWGLAGKQLFPWVQPAFRYSKLDPDFRNAAGFPAASVSWEWTKLDYGLRLAIVDGIDVTLEYADNSFILGSGAKRENNELLGTLRFKR